jgi:ESF2/ABP1 family protein
MARAIRRSKASDFFSVASEESDSERSHGDSNNTNGQDFFNLNEDGDENSQSSDEEEISRSRGRVLRTTKDDEDEDKNASTDDELNARSSSNGDDETWNMSGASTVKPLSEKEIEKSLRKIKKSGVVYISRIPPFMKPTKLRQILSRFGEVNRIFLAPEDPKVYARRVKYGGNKKKNFVEGWAEFTKKKHAKVAAEVLNGNIIGGKKGNYYHDDILNVKYLPKFKWNNLTEQIAVEAQSRHEKMRAEIAQATIENRMFIENVEKHKMIEGIKKKRGDDQKEEKDVRRTFVQRNVSSMRATDSGKPTKKPNANVLSSVF